MLFPKQYGPVLGGGDLFENDVTAKVLNARFVRDWDFYHLSHGEVHCGTFVRRQTFTLPAWWETAW